MNRTLLRDLSATSVVAAGSAGVGTARERRRRRRLVGLALLVAAVVSALTVGHVRPAMPHVDLLVLTPILFFVALGVVLVGTHVATGRSPHVVYRPEQIDVGLADVVGIDAVKAEVVRSLNLFLNADAFAREMGGRPRRGLLFEGAPGTGKTHTAKAMAAAAGVPFLYASATSFRSSFQGASARKARAYFRALRAAARREGGAIGFIDEFDAIGAARRPASMTPAGGALAAAAGAVPAHCGGLGGLPARYGADSAAGNQGGMTVSAVVGTEDASSVVNELLVQMQSFEQPTPTQRVTGAVVDAVNLLLPHARRLPKPRPRAANVMLIAATNRADALDPALLRPGRFDRCLSFDVPSRAGRRALVDHLLTRRAHEADLDAGETRDAVAAVTVGYTPAMLEGLFDEALVGAVNRGATAMNRGDVEQARLSLELGLANPTAYTERERQLVATHEAGHAVVAHLVAPQRRLEVLSIVKRRDSLGLLAHGDADDVYTRSREELVALVRISLAGLCAEELFFGDTTTGPGSDLLYATNVAAEMVGSAGMAGSLVSFAAIRAGALSDTNIVGRVLGDAEGRAAVDALLAEQHRYTRALVTANRHLVVALRDALLAREELIGTEILEVLATATPRPAVIDLTDPGQPAAPATASLPATGVVAGDAGATG